MWFGIVLSGEEITKKHYNIKSKFTNDNRYSIARSELIKSISEEFEIPYKVADAYITIASTYYSNSWFLILDNVVKLIRTEMCHSVYTTLNASGIEPTVENAKYEIYKLKEEIQQFN
ncbi:MAG: hypothetical protein K0R54_87 [Clostridiaceae bacterium]|jgi:hypothetical protein|nr:hypothetical protein [Clostridiaceae bacterium]